MDAGPKLWGWASLLHLVYPHNIFHNHCFEFLLGITVVPREIENNGHAVKMMCKRKFIYSYFEKGCRKKVHATIPKGNMGYDQCTVPDHCSCRTYFCCFPLALASICPWPLVPFCQISLKNKGLKTTHNTFPDCRVHFFRQPFSK